MADAMRGVASTAEQIAAAKAAPFIDTMVGALDPVGFFDPLGFAEKADDNTLKRYREAELTHGRVASKSMECKLL